METQAAIEQWLGWCLRHRAASTVKQFRSRLSSLTQRFGDRELSTLTALELDEWLHAAGLRTDGTEKAPDTRRNIAVAFEAFQSWAVRFDLLEAPKLTGIEKPRGRLRERLPTPEEVQAILDHASPEFALIFRALRQCGARPSELAAATVADLDREPGLIVLEEHKTARKTGVARKIPVGEKLRSLIEESLRARNVESGESRVEGEDKPTLHSPLPTLHLFTAPSGKPWTSANLSRTFARCRSRAGLDRRGLVLYLTRHEHATQVCREKGIVVAARVLGHSRTATTERYVKTAADELRDAQDSFEQG